MTQPIPPQPQPPPNLADEDLTPLEAAFYGLVMAALAAWLTKVITKVLEPFRLFGLMPSAAGVWATVPDWSARVDGLLSWLNRNAVPEGTERLREEHPDLRIPDLVSTDSFTQAHLARVRNYLMRIPDEVYQLVFAEISEGVNQGEDVRQVADRVQRVLTTTGSENWPSRAKVIAITETNGAANAGWYASAVNAQNELGARLLKEWVTAHDPRVRPSHRRADGQTKPLEQPFIVGGWPLMYPGDKNGPPEEVIGCRCTAVTKEVAR